MKLNLKENEMGKFLLGVWLDALKIWLWIAMTALAIVACAISIVVMFPVFVTGIFTYGRTGGVKKGFKISLNGFVVVISDQWKEIRFMTK
jgi:hypothetical protein